MLAVLIATWPLLVGVMLLLVGNGMQSSLLGIRGAIEGFSTLEISAVMSCYYVGYLAGSRMVPEMIQRVGHVRVFAALGSIISALIVCYPVLPDWMAWSLMRVLIGFSFSGVYITAESWLNNTSSNETRGQALSLYMIVQMIGIISSQMLLNLGDPGGFGLFVLPSVLVSVAFIPILLTVTAAPTFETTERLPFRRLYEVSPLGVVGMFLSGGIFSAMFGMASVWGTVAGLSVAQISVFIAAIYAGGLVLQYPIGWLSDRMDRRLVICGVAVVGAVAMLIAIFLPVNLWFLVPAAVVLGGVANPLYALLIAHTNDFLAKDQMAGASAGLLFMNGLGAIAGPPITGWMMDRMGQSGFFVFIFVLMSLVAAYAAFRMTQRNAPNPEETGNFAVMAPMAAPVAVGGLMEEAGQDTAATVEPR
ncbi:MFS transporter [Falsirhodobacter sp. 20TX0035]|uniref:MFS transporter n=1 Tax=Falsirhodobacter sp. 20TX0035 TaxID=3022019 RepID=UPI0023301BA6|nr:MFS transporter [Falsirhodobacter sp. 20TX0035]MDB6453574.1 MFS transporter [Falsirhodobacter sp. 20TX0035]